MRTTPVFKIKIYDETSAGLAFHTMCKTWRKAQEWIDQHNRIEVHIDHISPNLIEVHVIRRTR